MHPRPCLRPTLAFLLVAVGLPFEGAAITLDDGQVHTIDAQNSYALEAVEVADGPGGATTTIHIVDGGDIGSVSNDGLVASGASIVTMSGGTIARGVNAFGMTEVQITGGSIGPLEFHDFTTLMASGTVSPFSFSNLEVLDGATAALVDLRVGRVAADDNARVSLTRSGTTSGILATGSSIVEMFDGLDSHVLVGESAVFNASGGSIRGSSVASGPCTLETPVQTAVMNLQDVIVEGNLSIRANGVLNMTGGSTQQEFSEEGDVRSLGASVVNVFGSTIAGDLRAGLFSVSCIPPTASLEGGSAGRVVASGNGLLIVASGSVTGDAFAERFGVVELHGGSVGGDAFTEDSGVVELHGGTLGGMLIAIDDSQIRVFGTNFNYPLGEIPDTSGTLTGVLADGTPIDVPFARASTASILVPEPSPGQLGLAAVGTLLGVAAIARRRSSILSFLLVAALAFEAPAITLDDGQVHTIDAQNSYPFEAVEVADGPGGRGARRRPSVSPTAATSDPSRPTASRPPALPA